MHSQNKDLSIRTFDHGYNYSIMAIAFSMENMYTCLKYVLHFIFYIIIIR